MEYRFADQPQKAVDAGPELTDVTQSFGSVFKKIQTVDAVSEAQNQAAGDNRRDQRREDLRQRGDDSLQHILVFLRCLLYCVFGHPFDACCFYKGIVKVSHSIADDYLKLS